jgi:hypothetical protein
MFHDALVSQADTANDLKLLMKAVELQHKFQKLQVQTAATCQIPSSVCILTTTSMSSLINEQTTKKLLLWQQHPKA